MFIPDWQTDDETSTGLYMLCCMVMQLPSILQKRVDYGANGKVRMSRYRKEQDFAVYYYLQLADTLKYIYIYVLLRTM